ncbi:MAG: DUF1289 domain-containing protein [Gammaproteobacteria bacterium]|nr:DUF1289 domain-containing protein [Gammaproteobacteria bacterium]
MPDLPEAMSSPCVGVCSTTYGDLVCRGCHRFAHEVAQWNGYEPAQQVVVLERLADLRAGAASRHLSPERIDQLAAMAASVRLRRIEGWSAPRIAYEVLRRLSAWRQAPPWLAGDEDGVAQARNLLERVEKEIRQRSEAHYEHSFRIAAH